MMHEAVTGGLRAERSISRRRWDGTLDKLPLRPRRTPTPRRRIGRTIPSGASRNWIRVRAPNSPEICRDQNACCASTGWPRLCEGGGLPQHRRVLEAQRHATFMIMGDVCTRALRLLPTSPPASPGALNPHEPANIAEAVPPSSGLGHVVGDLGRPRRPF